MVYMESKKRDEETEIALRELAQAEGRPLPELGPLTIALRKNAGRSSALKNAFAPATRQAGVQKLNLKIKTIWAVLCATVFDVATCGQPPRRPPRKGKPTSFGRRTGTAQSFQSCSATDHERLDTIETRTKDEPKTPDRGKRINDALGGLSPPIIDELGTTTLTISGKNTAGLRTPLKEVLSETSVTPA